MPSKASPPRPRAIGYPSGMVLPHGVSGEVPTTAAKATPRTVAIHFAESRSRSPALLQHSCIPASGESEDVLFPAGQAGQMMALLPFP